MAQITIVNADIDPAFVVPEALLVADVMVPEPGGSYVFEARITDPGGSAVVRVVSEPLLLSAGMHQLAARGVRPASVNYAENGAGEHTRAHGMLPSGVFRYCMEALPVQGGEGSDVFCLGLEGEDLSYLDLVHPFHNDTIEEVRPLLSWVTSRGSVNDGHTHHRLILVDQPVGASSGQAVISGMPIVSLEPVQAMSVPYPNDRPALLRGHRYAWRVEEILSNGRVVNMSEAWSFVVSEDRVAPARKYVWLTKRTDGSSYRVTDERVYFRFDEPYASNEVRCILYDEDSKRITPELREDRRSSGEWVGAKSIGINEYELDLSSFHLKAGYYVLKVPTEEGEAYYLRLVIPQQ